MHRGSFKNLCGKDKRLMKMLSLETQVDNQTLPCFLWHTQQDNCVPCANSIVFFKQLQKHNITAHLQLYPKGGHGLALGNDIFCEVKSWVEKCVNFINKVLE